MTIVRLDDVEVPKAATPEKRKDELLDLDSTRIRTPSKTEDGDLGADQRLWQDVRRYLQTKPDMVQSLKKIASVRRRAETPTTKRSCGSVASVSKSPCKAERHSPICVRSVIGNGSERNLANLLLDESFEVSTPEAIVGDTKRKPSRRRSKSGASFPKPGQVFSLDAATATYVENGSDVILHVYDLTKWTKASNLPIYHLAVQVYRLEYFFCCRGIQSCIPMSNKGHVFKESVSLGKTKMSLKDVRNLLHKLRVYWAADSYRMLGRNCQTFALAFCEELGLANAIPPELSRFSDFEDVRSQVAGLVDGATSLIPRLPEGPAILSSCSLSEMGRTDICSTRSRPCISRITATSCTKYADASARISPTTTHLDLDKIDRWEEELLQEMLEENGIVPKLHPHMAPRP